MKTSCPVCVENSEYPASLEVHKIYRVVPDEDAEREEDLRIIGENGEDYLYPNRYFVAIDEPKETERALNLG
jgi:hypothetical protein